MKNIIHSAIILIISVVLALASAALINTGPHQTSGFAQYSNAAFFHQITPTPQPAQDHSEIGSTDGITVMSFIIVAIILIPILLKRKDWSQV